MGGAPGFGELEGDGAQWASGVGGSPQMLLGPEPMSGEPSSAGCSQLADRVLQVRAGVGWGEGCGSASVSLSYCKKVGRWNKPRRRPGGTAVFGEGKQGADKL